MKRYRNDTPGSPLLTSQGQILRLPFRYQATDIFDIYCSSALVVQLLNLNTEKWLITEPHFRLKLMADGSIWMGVNTGADGQDASAIFTASASDLIGAGVVLTTARPFLFYVQPVAFGGDTRANGHEFKIFIDGRPVPLAKGVISGFAWPKAEGFAIGGNSVASYSDFVAFEYFKLTGGQLSNVQHLAMSNYGRGVDITLHRWAQPRLIYLARFADQYYDSGNQWFLPILANTNFFTPAGSTNMVLYSSAFKTEYGDTNRLFFDGLNDFVAPADPEQVLTAEGYQEFTYEVEVQPNKTTPLPPEGGGGPMGFENQPNLPAVLSSLFEPIGTYWAVPFLSVGTNGVCFGLAYKSMFGNISFATLLSYAGAISSSQMSKIGIRFRNRTPELFINGTFKHIGVATAPERSPGSADGDWPIRLQCSAGAPMNGYNGAKSGPWSGFMRNFRVWAEARTDAQMGTASLPSGAEPTLLVFYPLSRIDALSGEGRPFSTVATDRTGKRPGALFNFVLSPAAAAYKQRIGRAIL